MGVVVASTAAVLAMFPRASEAPPALLTSAGAPATPAAASGAVSEGPSIRIEHELVIAPVWRPPVRRSPEVAPRHVRMAGRRPQPAGAIAGTRRLLFGDGKYRPEPFPRVGR